MYIWLLYRFVFTKCVTWPSSVSYRGKGSAKFESVVYCKITIALFEINIYCLCSSLSEYLGPASYDSDHRDPERNSHKVEIRNVTTDSYSDGSDSDNIPTIDAEGKIHSPKKSLLHTCICMHTYSKTCLKQPLKKTTKIGFQDWLWLYAGQESILQYFQPSLSYLLSLRSLFCLFLSGRLRQVLL